MLLFVKVSSLFFLYVFVDLHSLTAIVVTSNLFLQIFHNSLWSNEDAGVDDEDSGWDVDEEDEDAGVDEDI